jgi:DNA-binding LacI/PurR family transcriptional regulator
VILTRTTFDRAARAPTGHSDGLQSGHRHRGGPRRDRNRQDQGSAPQPHLRRLATSAPRSGVAFAERWLEPGRKRAATAIVCGNDDLAIGFLRTVLQRGVRVPGDISVTGFDRVPEGVLYWPGLTMVDQPSHDMGKAACQTLLRVIEGREPAAPTRTDLPARVVVRESTGPAHRAI